MGGTVPGELYGIGPIVLVLLVMPNIRLIPLVLGLMMLAMPVTSAPETKQAEPDPLSKTLRKRLTGISDRIFSELNSETGRSVKTADLDGIMRESLALKGTREEKMGAGLYHTARELRGVLGLRQRLVSELASAGKVKAGGLGKKEVHGDRYLYYHEEQRRKDHNDAVEKKRREREKRAREMGQSAVQRQWALIIRRDKPRFDSLLERLILMEVKLARTTSPSGS